MPDISPEKLPDLKLDKVLAAQPKSPPAQVEKAAKPVTAPESPFWWN
jgi:hypothetical protein